MPEEKKFNQLNQSQNQGQQQVQKSKELLTAEQYCDASGNNGNHINFVLGRKYKSVGKSYDDWSKIVEKEFKK